jgi:hypothetical protein
MWRRCDRLVMCLLVAVSGARPIAAFAEQPDPDLVQAVHVVRTFYKYHLRHAMGFDEGTLVKRKEWLAPDFYALLLAETRKRPGGEAPRIDGDPFTDSQEYPNRCSTGEARRTGEDEITVDVALRWVEEVTEHRQYRWRDEPVTREVENRAARHMKVRLTRGDRLWRIADVISEDGKSLRALLESGGREHVPTQHPGWLDQPAATDPLDHRN